ncbi:hypothetical protein [Paenibacillus wulumuqiensis]|uniref:hypothetical protein n=1 Tax=Paenibacillus wulumuqiensis TaxID=1567107 RepID=UPI0006963C64|nr:hypothetical protein [Paenibacillus wulumuqiensis]
MRNFKPLLDYVLLMLPGIILTMLLIKFFPYTGLARIVSIPVTLFINTFIVLGCLLIPYWKRWFTIFKIVVAVSLTIWVTIAFYPQESSPPITIQAREAISAIGNIDNMTRKDLDPSNQELRDNYVVALYKFKNEIPIDGTYQLYGRDNVYFYEYSIHSLKDIPSKLIGHHKLMWWYLSIFKNEDG